MACAVSMVASLHWKSLFVFNFVAQRADSFYLDFAGNTAEPVVQRALDHLSEITTTLRVLGSYARDMKNGEG